MKKTIFEHFGFWLRGVVCGALLLSAAVACSDDNDDPGAAAPEITLESVSTGQTEFSFRLRTNVDGAYGYQVVKRTQNDGIEKPDAASLFDEHTGTVNKETTVAVTGLETGCSYVLYAAVKAETLYSEVAELAFTTGVNSNEIIEVSDIGSDRFTFSIRCEGPYFFAAIPTATLNTYTIEEYLTEAGCIGRGEAEYDWVDGGEFSAENGTFSMKVIAGVPYVILMAPCDASYNITGEPQRLDFETLPRQGSGAEVEVELTEIASTSVKVGTSPGEGVAEYYVYVRDKEWYTNIIENNGGEAMAIHMIKYATDAGLGRKYEAVASEVWEGLKPSKEYYCGVVSVDFSGGENLQLVPFTTEESSGRVPLLEVEARKSDTNPSETLNLRIRSDIAYLGRYAVLAAAEVKNYEAQGKGDKEIISDVGTDLNIQEMEQVNTAEGYDIEVEFLYPGMEYVCIVAVRSLEDVEVYKRMTVRMDDWPSEARVESELFDVLPGTWTISYSYLDYNDMPQEIKDVEVKIEAGVDDKTCKEYRARNMLVLTGYPFQGGEPLYYSPADLMRESSWYSAAPELAYRDYGAKIFFHIGEGDEVTVPSSKSVYLYNWGDWPLLFVGMDYDKYQLAPASFPVEVSSDRRTLTIKQYVSGAEFEYGVYRPSVVMDGVKLNVAVSDIVLRKVD